MTCFLLSSLIVGALSAQRAWTLIIGVPLLIIGVVLLVVVVRGVIARRSSGGGL